MRSVTSEPHPVSKNVTHNTQNFISNTQLLNFL
ncbi:Uncharacterised protein [Vibrio cholerae]|nr:Uncharacterised protein [Vibrio cholerae]CSI25428.1 Uncharacterised protein [Vibrio cholerae]